MWIALIALPVAAIVLVGGFTAMTTGLEARSPDLLQLFREAEYTGGAWAAGQSLGWSDQC